jgi:type I restriction enzyme, S subunit
MKLERLGNICEVRNGYAFKSINFEKHGVPIIRISDINGNLVNVSKAVRIKFDHVFENFKIEKGDILIAMSGATTGKFGIYVEDEIAYQNQRVGCFKIKNLQILSYPYLLQSLKTIKPQIEKKAYGGGQPNISAKNIEDINILLPSLSDQLHIANILNKAENLISQRKESIRLLDKFLKSTFLEMFGDPSTNRMKFQRGTIREVAREVKYGTSCPAEEEGRYPYLRMNNITTEGCMDYSKLKYINVDITEKEKYSVKKGDLLFNRTNSKELVGKTGVFNLESEMIIAGYLIRVRTNEKANPWYLWGYLNSVHGKQTLFGMCKSIVGMANINAQELQNIKILMPPVELQHQFALIVKKTEALKTQYQQSLAELGNLFGSLSQKAFRGELSFKEDVLMIAAEPNVNYS